MPTIRRRCRLYKHHTTINNAPSPELTQLHSPASGRPLLLPGDEDRKRAGCHSYRDGVPLDAHEGAVSRLDGADEAGDRNGNGNTTSLGWRLPCVGTIME